MSTLRLAPKQVGLAFKQVVNAACCCLLTSVGGAQPTDPQPCCNFIAKSLRQIYIALMKPTDLPNRGGNSAKQNLHNLLQKWKSWWKPSPKDSHFNTTAASSACFAMKSQRRVMWRGSQWPQHGPPGAIAWYHDTKHSSLNSPLPWTLYSHIQLHKVATNP